jgi:hypothetical protein
MAVLFVFVTECAWTKAGVEPPVETAPVVNAAPTGLPPGHVEPTNYVVRERIVLTSEQEPTKSATQKSPVKKGKKSKKTS